MGIPSNSKWGSLQVASIAIEAALAPVVGGVIGFYIDQEWGTSPWGLAAGLLFGGVATATLIREISRRMDNER